MTAEFRTSALLAEAGFRHAFFTRRGGVSSGVFESLNFVAHRGDPSDNVQENLRRAGAALEVAPGHLYFLSQVHGVAVHEAGREVDARAFSAREGDIVVAHDPEVAAAIRTADCLPVLLACRTTGWVAACHSGWQGCERGAASAAVRALQERGARDLIAAIGPHITTPAFEVGQDVADRLQAASPDPDIVVGGFAKPHVDLAKMVRSQLRAEGVAAQHIELVPGCTVREPADFFSYRRDKNPSGRMLSAIVPRAQA